MKRAIISYAGTMIVAIIAIYAILTCTFIPTATVTLEDGELQFSELLVTDEELGDEIYDFMYEEGLRSDENASVTIFDFAENLKDIAPIAKRLSEYHDAMQKRNSVNSELYEKHGDYAVAYSTTSVGAFVNGHLLSFLFWIALAALICELIISLISLIFLLLKKKLFKKDFKATKILWTWSSFLCFLLWGMTWDSVFFLVVGFWLNDGGTIVVGISDNSFLAFAIGVALVGFCANLIMGHFLNDENDGFPAES